MRSYSRFIPEDEIDAVEQWRFGAIETAGQLLEAQVKQREAALDEAQQDLARQESFQAGYVDGVVQGRAQAQAEVQQQMADFLAKQAQESAQRLTELFATTQTQLDESQQAMAQGVLELSCELARQVVRQELSVNPNVLLPVIREALDLLGAEHRTAVVRMHPVDFDVLQGVISVEFSAMNLTLRADSSLQPGGCQVEAAGTVVDATLQKRWQRAVATLGLTGAWESENEPD
jgi:flagellar assembly protein FliH